METYSRRSGYNFHRKTNPFDDDSEGEFEIINGDEIRAQMQLVRERTLDSTKRSLALIEDSHDSAVRTGRELQSQGEQLNRIERSLVKIKNDMKIANRYINSMNGEFGSISNYFMKPQDRVPKRNPSTAIADLQAESSLYYHSRYERNGNEAGTRGNNQFQRNKYSSRDPHEREIETNLDLISRGLGRLKEDALILGGEIDRQNEQLNRLWNKTDKTCQTVEKADKKVKRISSKQ